jgi:serine/threonine protein kinase
MTLERGSLLNSRYRIVEILGQGGMGSIYRAVDENLAVDVAVKENLFTTEEYARQFRREAVILANLRHANLPRVTDHFVIDGQGQYLVMDYIEGEDLRERMDREGVLTDADAVILGVAICDALTYLHTRDPQVVHRDIKPGNVKISPSGRITLVDFGLVKVMYGSQATTTGARAMTPGYSPPEQYGTARTDHRTDIYSLGATLYVGLTGAMPEDALARAMQQTDLTPVRRHNPKVSRRLAGVIEKALEIKPEDRYQSAEEFKQALLKSRSITDRRQKEQLTLTPPPETSTGNGPGADLNSSSVAVANDIEWPVSSDTGSPLLPPSKPFGEQAFPLSSRPSRRRRVGCLYTLLFVLLLAGGALGAVYFQPSLVDRGLAMLGPLVPMNNTPTMVHSPTPDSSPGGGVNISTSTPTQKKAITSAQEAVLPPTNTPTLKPTRTPRPTDTPVPTETPTGGGVGQIAFASDRTGMPQIWRMNADGTGLLEITDMPEGACQPAWSPDGGKLVFISPCLSNQESYPGASLFIVNADGSGVTPLPAVPGGDFDPAWSPDGTRIAFTSMRDYNRSQIYVINLEDNSVASLSNNKVRDIQPAWSPDGKRIAFISTRQGPSQIWIMDADGSNQERFSRSGSLKNSHPVWSPDGQLIVFNQGPVLGGVPRLMGVRVEGEPYGEFKIVSDVTPMREAVYSPDGFWLAYESWPEGENHDIFIMTTNAVARQRLTDDPALDFDPAWRPAMAQP